jgi:hypothetical protein
VAAKLALVLCSSGSGRLPAAVAVATDADSRSSCS